MKRTVDTTWGAREVTIEVDSLDEVPEGMQVDSVYAFRGDTFIGNKSTVQLVCEHEDEEWWGVCQEFTVYCVTKSITMIDREWAAEEAARREGERLERECAAQLDRKAARANLWRTAFNVAGLAVCLVTIGPVATAALMIVLVLASR